MLQARLAQFHFASEREKAFYQLHLAFMQRLAGDTAGAKLSAEQARTTYEQLHRDQPEKSGWAAGLSLAYAAMGDKDSALKLAERAIVLLPRAKDAMGGPGFEENLALIQTIFGKKRPCHLNSYPVVTNALCLLHRRGNIPRSAYYAGPS